MAEEKNYARGCWAREKVFSNGNSIIKLSGKADEFCAWLKSITDDKGEFRIGISKRREIIEGKPTHTVWQDTWKPIARSVVVEVLQQGRVVSNEAAAPAPAPTPAPEQGDDNISFDPF
jgi:hypothetical protein